MRGILFPSSNVIFEAEGKDPGAPPDTSDLSTAGRYARLYGGWEAVENASIALYESANLVQLPGRLCQNGAPVPLAEETFQRGLAALRESALGAYQVAQAKNWDGIPQAAERLAAACTTCHEVYRDRLIDEKPMTMEQRCRAK